MIKATMNGFLVICIGIVVVFGMRMPKSQAQAKDTDYKALYFADNKLFNEALQRERELKTALQSEHERAAREHEGKLAAERQRDSYLLKINQAKTILQ